MAQVISALCFSPLKPSVVCPCAASHVRVFPHLISPVLRGFFSGYSGFLPSVKSAHIGDTRATELSVSIIDISIHNTALCYPHKITMLSKLIFHRNNRLFALY